MLFPGQEGPEVNKVGIFTLKCCIEALVHLFKMMQPGPEVATLLHGVQCQLKLLDKLEQSLKQQPDRIEENIAAVYKAVADIQRQL